MDFKNLSVAEISSFVQSSGVPAKYCKALEDHCIDGPAFVELNEGEIREMVPPIGLVKKVMALIPKDVEIHNTCDKELKEFSVDDLNEYLSDTLKIPLEFCENLEDNFIDGKALFQLSWSEIREMVHPIGLAKRIMRLVKPKPDESAKTPSKDDYPQSISSVQTPATSLASSVFSASQNVRAPSTGASHSSAAGGIVIPDHWRPEVESCIAAKYLSDNARAEIKRTLVSQLFAKSSRPNRSDCDQIARKLILKYPFMKDNLGNGYQSWSDLMVDRIQNVIKADRRKARQAGGDPCTSPKKRQKKDIEKQNLARRYPITSTSTLVDAASTERHKKAIDDEMDKAKPRDTVLLPLMKMIYGDRRMFVMNDATSVAEILSCYPALKRPPVIEQEFGLILGKSSAKADFTSEWNSKYVPAIITYGQQSGKKAINSVTHDVDMADDFKRQETALRILGRCFAYKSSKDLLNCFFEEYDEAGSMDDALKADRPSPRVVVFSSATKKQFYVLIEKEVLCEIPCISTALFVAFASYYVFNLEYPKPVKNILYFFQDFIVKHPDSRDRNGTYLAITSDINRFS